jgi:enoyl-CoA hydratase/carnithine racemase
MGCATRALLVSNELLDGRAALARGLATHAVPAESLDAEVAALVTRLLAKGPEAMRATKRLIRSIEERGSGERGPAPGLDAMAAARTRDASVALGREDEFATMLRAFWAAKSAERPAGKAR